MISLLKKKHWVYIEGWERKGSKCFFTYIHLEPFPCPWMCWVVLLSFGRDCPITVPAADKYISLLYLYNIYYNFLSCLWSFIVKILQFSQHILFITLVLFYYFSAALLFVLTCVCCTCMQIGWVLNYFWTYTCMVWKQVYHIVCMCRHI